MKKQVTAPQAWNSAISCLLPTKVLIITPDAVCINRIWLITPKHSRINLPNGKWVQKKQVTISARPFMQLTDADEKEIIDDIQAYFRKLI